MFDVQSVRQDFPILHQEVNGKPLIYLDSAASAQKPKIVMDALNAYYELDNANVHRGAHTLADRATVAFEASRNLVADYIGAASTKEVIWTKGTTEGFNLLAHSLGTRLNQGDEIILSRMEHHANIVPWQMLAERTGAVIQVIDLNEAGEFDLEGYRATLSEKTKIVSVGHVSNALGVINPIEEIIQLAKTAGAISIIDGAQGVPHFKVDVQALDCDFYLFSAHKLFGPTGLGVLYGKESLLEAMPPFQGGGEMIEHVSFEKTTYNRLPFKFEAGTPAIAQVVSFGAAINYLNELDIEGAHAHERRLKQHIDERAQDIEAFVWASKSPNRVALASFNVDGMHASDVGTLLDQQGIGIRTGHHCAMPLMEYLGVSGTARASFAFYNTLEEVDQLFDALIKVIRLFR